MTTTKTAIITTAIPVSAMPAEGAALQVGAWYWVNEDELKRQMANRRDDPAIEEDADYEDDEDASIEDEIDDLGLDLEEAGRDDDEDEEPETEEDFRWLGCIVRLGTNYAKLEGFAGNDWGGQYSSRVHFDYFDSVCTPEPNAEAIINGNVNRHTGNAQALMAKVVEITRRLGVAPRAEIADGVGAGETQALALRGNGESIATYKQSLIKAKTEELPALFKQIEKENKIAAGWMTAQIIPLKAQAAGLQPMIKAIENRIFSVELYAGLIEEVVLIADGEPAPIGTKITLMQRRCYMDEECLARYEAGGMDYSNIEDFDRWMARPANRDRLLPAPRCIVAFRVRRYDKDREAESLREFIKIIEEREADRQTFLYIRNGERLYRLSTGIDFGRELFPDIEHLDTTQRMYVRRGSNDRDRGFLITEGMYRTWKAEDDAHEASKRKVSYHYKGEKKATRIDICSCNEDDLKGEQKVSGPWFWCTYRSKIDGYEPYTPDSVYYDDATQHLADEQARHNRLVLVLQGLLDRSPVMHPHPQWKLWTPDGFMAALVLVYDSGRAITPGAAPDFEAYRKRLNASIKAGTITVGQEDAWLEREAVRENDRQARDYRIRYKSDYRRYRPHGNPGPGRLARAVSVSKQGATFRWTRKKKTGRKVFVPNPERPGWGWNRTVYDETSDSITVPTGRLLNVDAYTPGDFHQFFDDPRTRQEYLQWAPLLLTAEDYHAGKRRLREDEPPVRDGEPPIGATRTLCSSNGDMHGWTGDAKAGDPCDCGKEKWAADDSDDTDDEDEAIG